MFQPPSLCHNRMHVIQHHQNTSSCTNLPYTSSEAEHTTARPAEHTTNHVLLFYTQHSSDCLVYRQRRRRNATRQEQSTAPPCLANRYVSKKKKRETSPCYHGMVAHSHLHRDKCSETRKSQTVSLDIYLIASLNNRETQTYRLTTASNTCINQRQNGIFLPHPYLHHHGFHAKYHPHRHHPPIPSPTGPSLNLLPDIQHAHHSIRTLAYHRHNIPRSRSFSQSTSG